MLELRKIKKTKSSVEDDELAVYNQLTGSVKPDETAGYPQFKNCGEGGGAGRGGSKCTAMHP